MMAGPKTLVMVTSVIILGTGLAWAVETGRPPTSQPSTATAPAPLVVTSSAFAPNKSIPIKHTGDGLDLSPPIQWAGAPDGTKSWALICEDPDAPRPQPWVHWVVYNLPADTTGLPENLPRTAKLEQPAGAMQGVNSAPQDNIGYMGPSPPPGKPHRYIFTVYALDTTLDLKPGADKQALVQAMKGHILKQGQLLGFYHTGE